MDHLDILNFLFQIRSDSAISAFSLPTEIDTLYIEATDDFFIRKLLEQHNIKTDVTCISKQDIVSVFCDFSIHSRLLPTQIVWTTQAPDQCVGQVISLSTTLKKVILRILPSIDYKNAKYPSKMNRKIERAPFNRRLLESELQQLLPKEFKEINYHDPYSRETVYVWDNRYFIDEYQIIEIDIKSLKVYYVPSKSEIDQFPKREEFSFFSSQKESKMKSILKHKHPEEEIPMSVNDSPTLFFPQSHPQNSSNVLNDLLKLMKNKNKINNENKKENENEKDFLETLNSLLPPKSSQKLFNEEEKRRIQQEEEKRRNQQEEEKRRNQQEEEEEKRRNQQEEEEERKRIQQEEESKKLDKQLKEAISAINRKTKEAQENLERQRKELEEREKKLAEKEKNFKENEIAIKDYKAKNQDLENKLREKDMLLKLNDHKIRERELEIMRDVNNKIQDLENKLREKDMLLKLNDHKIKEMEDKLREKESEMIKEYNRNKNLENKLRDQELEMIKDKNKIKDLEKKIKLKSKIADNFSNPPMKNPISPIPFQNHPHVQESLSHNHPQNPPSNIVFSRGDYAHGTVDNATLDFQVLDVDGNGVAHLVSLEKNFYIKTNLLTKLRSKPPKALLIPGSNEMKKLRICELVELSVELLPQKYDFITLMDDNKTYFVKQIVSDHIMLLGMDNTERVIRKNTSYIIRDHSDEAPDKYGRKLKKSYRVRSIHNPEVGCIKEIFQDNLVIMYRNQYCVANSRECELVY